MNSQIDETEIVTLTRMVMCNKCQISTEHATRVVKTHTHIITQWFCLTCSLVNESSEEPIKSNSSAIL